MSKTSVDYYLLEQERLAEYRRTQPELVTPRRKHTYEEILKHIGIEFDFGYLPQGYLNLYPQDFIVEELDLAGGVSTIEPNQQETVPAKPSGRSTLYADLVKVGFSSIEAVQTLAAGLGVDVKEIGYAGIKDKVAITSQRISIRNFEIEKLKQFHGEGVFLKNYTWGKGVVGRGAISGNRFTITVRTPVTLGQGWLDTSLKKLENGFYNFYFLQRFGSPRLLSHALGRIILQQDYEQAVRVFLSDQGVQDVGLLNRVREQAARDFGKWAELEQAFSLLPYTFRLELALVRYLKNHPADFRGALKQIDDQVTLWVYAYASYLFNKHLSSLIARAENLPAELPLLLNPAYKTVDTYVANLERDGITDLGKSVIKIFGHNVLQSKNSTATVHPAKINVVKIIEGAVVINFDLPKAAYATTFLTHMFSLFRGLPLPEWLNKEKVDGKKILGLGSVEDCEQVLGDYIFTPHLEE
ncbi:MAG: tRNA pseudouridine(13) synthase TruD [Candidatus Buchananbacteria bacterium]|nr:tRNA pseudouridine(13) synthase TruD [Candidatus Buchananbacteria bacterium]